MTYQCRECGKLFDNQREAEQAMWNGCPNCNGVNIGIAPYDAVDTCGRCD